MLSKMDIQCSLKAHFAGSAPVLFEGRFLSDPFENRPWTPRGDTKITRRESGRAAQRSVQGKSIHREEVRLREWLRRFPVDAMMDLSTSARRRVRRPVPSRAELSRLLSLSLALSFSLSLSLVFSLSFRISLAVCTLYTAPRAGRCRCKCDIRERMRLAEVSEGRKSERSKGRRRRRMR